MWRVAVLIPLLSMGAREAGAMCVPGDIPALQRFVAAGAAGAFQDRALRHLEAHTAQFDKTAWMDVWTEADASGFRYEVAGDGGSRYIQMRVFLPALEAERALWASGGRDRGAINPQNYTFESCAPDAAGLEEIAVKPRRKDVMLVEGSIFLRPEDGDLVRVQGMLSKSPSFWTRHVEIVRLYERVAGVRMPVRFETMASVLFAGQSSFTMTYMYQTVNGQTVEGQTITPR